MKQQAMNMKILLFLLFLILTPVQVHPCTGNTTMTTLYNVTTIAEQNHNVTCPFFLKKNRMGKYVIKKKANSFQSITAITITGILSSVLGTYGLSKQDNAFPHLQGIHIKNPVELPECHQHQHNQNSVARVTLRNHRGVSNRHQHCWLPVCNPSACQNGVLHVAVQEI